MGELPPIRRFTAEVERQTANTEIRKRIGQKYGDLNRRIQLARTESRADSRIAAANNYEPHVAPGGRTSGKRQPRNRIASNISVHP
jgi:hypothetical protein